jgi:hypothetical protein
MEVAEPIDLDGFELSFNFIDDYPFVKTGANAGIFIDCSGTQKYGRFTFEKLDSIKISRGEFIPYQIKQGNKWNIAFNIKNSNWLIERYEYEKKHYGKSYEFNGDVEEMMIDYKHLLFFFGENFVEVICRGFWYEESEKEHIQSELSKNHPFKKLSKENALEIKHAGLIGYIYQNNLNKQQLIKQAKYCSQKQFSFGVEPHPHKTINLTIQLMERNGRITSSLRGYFGAEIQRFDKVLELEDVIPIMKKNMENIAERRNK